jgi:hypothetical protein
MTVSIFANRTGPYDFLASLFTLAASTVNHIEVYLSISLFHLYPLRRDDA